MNKQELAEQILKGYSPAIRTTDGNYAWEEEDVLAAIVEMGVRQPTHYHVADNSNGFRDWLDKKKIEWMPNGHFTTIPLEGNDIFKLGLEFGLYRKEVISAPAKAVEAMDSLPAQKGDWKERFNKEVLFQIEGNGRQVNYNEGAREAMEWIEENVLMPKGLESINDYVPSNSAPSTRDENTEGRV
jgi:hypothetical protein